MCNRMLLKCSFLNSAVYTSFLKISNPKTAKIDNSNINDINDVEIYNDTCKT